jgi:hypothetical protein
MLLSLWKSSDCSAPVSDVGLAALLQLLACPVPSVAGLLLHCLKRHFAACWPPDEAALAAVLQLLPVSILLMAAAAHALCKIAMR